MYRVLRSAALAAALVLPSLVAVAPPAAAQTATTVTVTATPTAVQEGGPVAVRATVKTAAGTPVTTGTVRFVVGDVYECQDASGVLNSSGVATATVEMVTVEDGAIHAYYDGDATHAPASTSTTVRVDPVVLPTQLDLTGRTGHSAGQVVLEGYGTGGWHWSCGYYDQNSEGPVDFYAGGQLLGTEYTSEWGGYPAELDVALAAGTHQIRAVYRPNAIYTMSGSAIGFAGNSATMALTVSADSVTSTSELVRNPSFETDTSGWGSLGGTVTRVTRTGAPHGTAVAKAAWKSGTVYSLTDTTSTTSPTVTATTAGATYVAAGYAAAATSSAVGKPISIILRERTPAGALVRQTVVKTKLGTAFKRLAVSAKASGTGNTLGLRVEQSSAVSGNAFFADNLGLRHASQLPGAAKHLTSYEKGTVWTGLTANAKRASLKKVPAPLDVASMAAYLDGKGATTGSQAIKGVIYTSANGAPGSLVATTTAVSVKAGRTAGYVELRFASPVRLAAGDYWFGLISGGTSNVARYLAEEQASGLRTNVDTYSDGATKSFGTATTGDKNMLLHVVGG